jgi:hypothetical protein
MFVTSSTVCDPGYYSLGNQQQCTYCDEGYRCQFTNNGPELCPLGYYSEAMATNCSACEAGFYCPEPQCMY